MAVVRNPAIDYIYGRVLRELREAQGVNSTDFAKILCVQQEELSKIEHGYRTITVSHLALFAMHLGTTPSAIVTLVEKRMKL